MSLKRAFESRKDLHLKLSLWQSKYTSTKLRSSESKAAIRCKKTSTKIPYLGITGGLKISGPGAGPGAGLWSWLGWINCTRKWRRALPHSAAHEWVDTSTRRHGMSLLKVTLSIVMDLQRPELAIMDNTMQSVAFPNHKWTGRHQNYITIELSVQI